MVFGIQVHARHVLRRIVQIKVSGVHTYHKWYGSIEDGGQPEWTQRDVRALPVERENHLKTQKQAAELFHHSVVFHYYDVW